MNKIAGEDIIYEKKNTKKPSIAVYNTLTCTDYLKYNYSILLVSVLILLKAKNVP